MQVLHFYLAHSCCRLGIAERERGKGRAAEVSESLVFAERYNNDGLWGVIALSRSCKGVWDFDLENS